MPSTPDPQTCDPVSCLTPPPACLPAARLPPPPRRRYAQCLDDPTKLDEYVRVEYGKADKAREGYIPTSVAPQVAAKVLKRAKIKTITQVQITQAFSKAGSDGKITEKEFSTVIDTLMGKTKASDSAAVEAAAEAAYPDKPQ